MELGVSDFQTRGPVIASATTGRIRLRVLRGPRTSAELAALAQTLESFPEVVDVKPRPHSASVVIGFDSRDTATVEAHLHGLGISNKRQSAAEPPPRDPAATIRDAATAIDRAVGNRVPGANLRLLVPLTLGLLSLRQLVRGDDRLSDAPWYLLAMYAADSFSRLQPGPSSPRGAGDAGDDV